MKIIITSSWGSEYTGKHDNEWQNNELIEMVNNYTNYIYYAGPQKTYSKDPSCKLVYEASSSKTPGIRCSIRLHSDEQMKMKKGLLG